MTFWSVKVIILMSSFTVIITESMTENLWGEVKKNVLLMTAFESVMYKQGLVITITPCNSSQ